jgi:hypothetical protein
VTLEAWDSWAEGERCPTLSGGRLVGSPAVATGHFLAAYDKFVVGRPTLKAAVEANLRADPELRLLFEGNSESEAAKATGASSDSIRKAILDATVAERYRALAAAIDTPILTAACASLLQPGGLDDHDFAHEQEIECQSKLVQLTDHAQLNPVRCALAMFNAGTRRGHLEVARLVQDIASAAERQLARRDGVPYLTEEATRHTEDTAALQSMLNRVAPRQGGAAAIAPEAFFAGADSETVAMIHEAIGTTIDKAVAGLPLSSGRAGLSALAQRSNAQSMALTEPTTSFYASRQPVRVADGTQASLSAKQPSSSAKDKTVSFNSEPTIKSFDASAPPADVSKPVDQPIERSQPRDQTETQLPAIAKLWRRFSDFCSRISDRNGPARGGST